MHFKIAKTGPGALQAWYSMRIWGFFLGKKSGRDVRLTIHLHQKKRLRINESIPLVPLYAFTVCIRITLPLNYNNED
jgi:hypothetical protein